MKRSTPILAVFMFAGLMVLSLFNNCGKFAAPMASSTALSSDAGGDAGSTSGSDLPGNVDASIGSGSGSGSGSGGNGSTGGGSSGGSGGGSGAATPTPTPAPVVFSFTSPGGPEIKTATFTVSGNCVESGTTTISVVFMGKSVGVAPCNSNKWSLEIAAGDWAGFGFWLQATQKTKAGIETTSVLRLNRKLPGIGIPTVVSGSEEDTCVILGEGRIQCWGDNTYGQLGNGNAQASAIPQDVSDITNAISIAVGNQFACALLSTGKVNCWGSGIFGTLGPSQTPAYTSKKPVEVPGLDSAVSISAGPHSVCVVLYDHSLRCWGHESYYGELGDGLQMSDGTPVIVSGISNAISVSEGDFGGCAVLSDGGLKCWGNNLYGAVGNRDTLLKSDGTHYSALLPYQIPEIKNAANVTAGPTFVCARLMTGQINCWGSNASSSFGDGTTKDSRVPVLTSGINNAISVVTRGAHVCAVLADLSLSCWGYALSGALGYNSPDKTSPVPRAVAGLSNVISVGMGTTYTCAVQANGQLFCFGDNTYSQLGSNSLVESITPVSVNGIKNALTVSGGLFHSCAVVKTGEVLCWGDNSSGQLGNDSRLSSAAPLPVKGITNAKSVSSNNNTSCAVLADGKIACWGDDSWGKIGNASVNVASQVPVYVDGIDSAVSVSVSYYRACATLASGEVRCWGENSSGSLGDRTTTSAKSPVSMLGVTNAVDAQSGTNLSCMRLKTGEVQCLGVGYSGALGDGKSMNSFSPVNVVNINNAVQLGVGYSDGCAVLATGDLKCWGIRNGARYGSSDSFINSATPTAIAGVSNVATLSENDSQFCMTLTNGYAKCLGRNNVGQLGNNSISSSYGKLVDVLNVKTAVQVAVSDNATYFVLSDGSILASGQFAKSTGSLMASTGINVDSF